MAHFQKKLEEMQKKLNLINVNIEEIKNGRKNFEEKQNIKYNDFLRNSIRRKNGLKNHNNNSINFFNKKCGKDFYQYRNSYSNINLFNNTNNNLICNIQKKSHFTNSKLNLNNNNLKYLNYPFEENKNETPTFVKNINLSKNYQLQLNSNDISEIKNTKKLKKINSASQIMHSISVIKNHKKFKKFIKNKKSKNRAYFLEDIKINNSNSNSNYNSSNNFSSSKKSNSKYRSLNIKENFSYNDINEVPKFENAPRTLSIDNKKMKHILNKQYHSNSHSINAQRCKKRFKNIIYNNIHENLLLDMIDMTNEYNKSIHKKKKVNIDNILKEYKLLLYENKIKNEFIFNVINLFNKNNKLYLDIHNINSLPQVLNWINDISYKVRRKENDNNDEKYKILCLDIMKKYKLENIEQLKLFIMKLLAKVNNNDYFLEGIKKILLP